MNVREYNSIDQLAPLRDQWRALLDQTSHATFFQSFEWLQAYWRHHRDSRKLRVLVAHEGERAVGIVPLIIRDEATRLGPLRCLSYPLDYWGSFYGPVGPNSAAVLRAAMQHIRTSPRDWDMIELRWVTDREDQQAATASAMTDAGLGACSMVVDHSPIIQLDGGWDAFVAARSSKWRNNLRRWRRRLEAKGELRHVRYRPQPGDHHGGAPRWDLYEDCLRIAEASWQGSITHGTTLSHAHVRDFLRDAHAAAAATGALDLNLLYVDDRPVSFAYNYLHDGYVFGLRVGFDPEFSRDGAGNVLYTMAIQDSFQRGDRVYDLGPGSLDGKRNLATHVLPIHRVGHYPALGLRTPLIRLKRRFDSYQAAHASLRAG